jgi:hypothetical protein
MLATPMRHGLLTFLKHRLRGDALI